MIRTLGTTDLHDLLALYEQLHEFDLPLPEQAQIEQVWDEALRNDGIRYFGYFVEEQLRSTCTITVIPNLTRACRPYAVIENVVTHRQYRMRGYGRAVLRAALEFAWERNCYKVMLMSGRLDEGTFSFYESIGFLRDKKQAFVLEHDMPPAPAATPVRTIPSA